MLGMGPILWDQAHREMYRYATTEPPVDRDEALLLENPWTTIAKYRYRYPAAWLYYERIDALTALKETP